jgi:RNA recognition motif-containing protein
MGNRLCVGSLPFSVTEAALREAFASGAVTGVHIVNRRETGHSRGVAFVTTGTAREAAKAISSMEAQKVVVARAART